MSAYRITCSECSTQVHGWTKAEARAKFAAHCIEEHPNGYCSYCGRRPATGVDDGGDAICDECAVPYPIDVPDRTNGSER